MSAGTFIVATMRKREAELVSANIVSAARQHQIPVEWARFYVAEELSRKASGE